MELNPALFLILSTEIPYFFPAIRRTQRQQNDDAAGDGCAAANGGVAAAGIAAAVGWRWSLRGEVNG
jgi:hypothetical protein